MKENKKATIIDVARLAGVSIATVSRALHNPEIVSKKTRDRVTEAIKSVEYTQNEAARILRLNRSKTIVALVPNIGNPFFSEILLGIESVASENGYSVLIGNTGNDEKKELTYLSFLKSNRADGIILLTGRDPFSVIPKNNGALKSASIPTVVACERIAGFSAPQVFVDNHNAAATATRHLVSLGHRHIAHITGPKGNILTADRLAGYREALAGLGMDERYIIQGDFTVKSGIDAFSRLFALEDRPTAVFCANDEMAMGLISALVGHGFSVPRDISVVGFDNIQFSHCMNPPLTTIHQPRYDIGRVAMEKLIKEMSDEINPDPHKTILTTRLIIRKSTAPL